MWWEAFGRFSAEESCVLFDIFKRSLWQCVCVKGWAGRLWESLEAGRPGRKWWLLSSWEWFGLWCLQRSRGKSSDSRYIFMVKLLALASRRWGRVRILSWNTEWNGGPIGRVEAGRDQEVEDRDQDFHLFIQQVFPEPLLCAGCCAES